MINSKLYSQKTTNLIFNGKDHESDVGTWRLIIIFSVLRRIIERSLDQELRSRIQFCCHQRGFVAGVPGTQNINASKVCTERTFKARPQRANG